MFNECSSLISLPDISNWNISEVKNMSFIFNECNSLISFPNILKWNVLHIREKRNLFKGCFNALIDYSDITK